jgi:hypothetical protein
MQSGLHTGRAGARGRGGCEGDTDPATRFYLRILERDPYDESAHLGLVNTLEARRTARRGAPLLPEVLRATDEIGVESAPFPAVDRAAGDLTTP